MSEPDRKKKILRKAERNLSTHIKHGDSADKIEASAENVRVSQLSFFKGQREIAKYESIEKSEKFATINPAHKYI